MCLKYFSWCIAFTFVCKIYEALILSYSQTLLDLHTRSIYSNIRKQTFALGYFNGAF